jgi:dCMP deaminase
MKPKVTTKKILAGYIPVIHKGYVNFFKKFNDIDGIYVFDRELIQLEDYLRKDLRALNPSEAVLLIRQAGYHNNVQLLNVKLLKILDNSKNTFILPDDDVSHVIVNNYIRRAKINYYPVFLRWDRRSLDHLNRHSEKVLTAADNQVLSIMNQALDTAKLSSDIWRRVGAILTDRTGKVIDISENRSEPTQFTPWIDGDTRAPSNAGSNIELNIFMHAEARIIARAAKRGIKLDGLNIYVTTFPCPVCAMLISESGIKNLFYKDGYALLNGAEVLKQHGVNIRRVLINDIPDNKAIWIKYPKKTNK